MKTKVDQFMATNPSPMLIVYKDWTVLQINEVSEPLLHNLGVAEEKLPAYTEDFVQRVISLNSPEKM